MGTVIIIMVAKVFNSLSDFSRTVDVNAAIIGSEHGDIEAINPITGAKNTIYLLIKSITLYIGEI